jgi:uncharacterized membrane protein
VYFLVSHYRAGAIAIWIGVMSHWVLDWISHRPGMPLYPGGPRVGLGLWNSIPGTMIVEGGLFAMGVWLYVQTTRARDRIGRYALAAYVILLLLLWISDRFSSPPPSVVVLGWASLIAVAVLIPWAWWFDCHRATVDAQNTN